MTGNLVGTWRTITAAVDATKTCETSIRAACKGKKGLLQFHRANGFYWKYENTAKEVEGVIAYKNGYIYGQWYNIKVASEMLNISVGGITEVCKGSKSSCYGIVFRRVPFWIHLSSSSLTDVDKCSQNELTKDIKKRLIRSLWKSSVFRGL